MRPVLENTRLRGQQFLEFRRVAHAGEFGVLLQFVLLLEALFESLSQVLQRQVSLFHGKMYANGGPQRSGAAVPEKGSRRGLQGEGQTEEDPEFAGMRDTPEFKELLASEPRVL